MSNAGIPRIAVAQQTFRTPVPETYAALIQMVAFSAAFDLLGHDDSNRSISFLIPNVQGEFEARVQASSQEGAVVIIEAPLGVGNIDAQCNRLYRELAEQLAVQQPIQLHDNDKKLSFWQSIARDNNGPRSKLAIGALVVSIIGLMAAWGNINISRPNWDGVVVMIVVMAALSIAAYAVTGPHGKVSGRLMAIAAAVISLVATVVMLISMTVIQIRYSTSYAASPILEQVISVDNFHNEYI